MIILRGHPYASPHYFVVLVSMRVACSVVLVLLAFCGHSHGQHRALYQLNALVMERPWNLGEGAYVNLRCEYYLNIPLTVTTEMRISFLPKKRLNADLTMQAKSTQFLFPLPLKFAHEKNGTILKVSYDFLHHQQFN